MELRTLFPDPKDAQTAVRQCNIVDRAKTLFTTGGYDWYIADTHTHLFGICGPRGQHYKVDMERNNCSCPGFEQDGDCKHRIAVSLAEDCYTASQVRQLERALQDADVCASDRVDRLVREAGGGC